MALGWTHTPTYTHIHMKVISRNQAHCGQHPPSLKSATHLQMHQVIHLRNVHLT